MDINMDIIGNRIKMRRRELNLTQTDIYHKCGIASGALSQIENGTRVPSAIAFYNISQALNCSMDYLMTGDSSFTKTDMVYESEKSILNSFRQLSQEDQDELLEILAIKLRKTQRKEGSPSAKSSTSTTIENRNLVG